MKGRIFSNTRVRTCWNMEEKGWAEHAALPLPRWWQLPVESKPLVRYMSVKKSGPTIPRRTAWNSNPSCTSGSTTTKTDAHGKHSSTTSEVIHTNQKHPFLTKEKGFLPVGQIKLGMHVLEANGQYGVVTGWKVVPGTKVMYNLEVAHDHTFTVGGEQWVVHNDCGSLPEQAEARAREIGANIDAQVGKWNRSALTVATAIVDDGGEVRTLIATNEKASSSLVKLVTAQLKEGETFISLAEKQGRHAEQVLYSYIQDKGLKVLGFGASNDFCDEMCRPMLQQGLGPDVLGQP